MGWVCSLVGLFVGGFVCWWFGCFGFWLMDFGWWVLVLLVRWAGGLGFVLGFVLGEYLVVLCFKWGWCNIGFGWV